MTDKPPVPAFEDMRVAKKPYNPPLEAGKLPPDAVKVPTPATRFEPEPYEPITIIEHNWRPAEPPARPPLPAIDFIKKDGP